MHKKSISFTFMLVLGLFLLTAGCTQDNTDTLPQDTYTSNETLVAFVDSAAAYVKTNGKEKALAEFNNPNGSFIDGELYIFAYDFNGTTLAHPVNPEKVGINRLNEEGAGAYLKECSDAVRNGNCFRQIEYINPTHNRTLESKLLYCMKIDEDWWLASGIYTGPAEPSPVQ